MYKKKNTKKKSKPWSKANARAKGKKRNGGRRSYGEGAMYAYAESRGIRD